MSIRSSYSHPKKLKRGSTLALAAAVLVLAPNVACKPEPAPDSAAPAFEARVNTGTSARVTAANGTAFAPDRHFSGGSNSGDITKNITGTVDPALYYAHRWGMKGYDIPVTHKGTYTVRLHFAETIFTQRGKRVFDVNAEGSQKINDLDVFAEVGSSRALVKTFTVPVTDGALNLAFAKVIEDPMVSAIEVTGPANGNGPTTPPTPPPTTKPPAPTTPPTTKPPTTTPPVTPPQTGYPNAANTGPSGTLKASGSITTTRDGQVIENLDINGEVRVVHNNVKIRNVRIRSAGGHAIYILNNTGLVVEDCELDGQGRNAEAAVAHHNYTMRRCEVKNFGEGPRINGSVTLENNYIHQFANFISQGAHQDGIQATSGNNVVIRHNTVIIEPDGANGGIYFSTSNGSNILIEDNVVGGGNWAIQLDPARYTNVRVLNNRITTTIPGHSKGGYFGAISAPGMDVRGNVWHDGPNAGKPIS